MARPTSVRSRRTLAFVTLSALVAAGMAAPVVAAPRPASASCTVSPGVTITVARGTTIITGTAGDDTIDCTAVTNAKASFRIAGNGGSDVIDGGAEKDLIITGLGHSIVRGGGGDDVMYPNGGTGSFHGGTGDDAISLLPAGPGASAAYGGDGDDLLVGSASVDVLDGAAGFDRCDDDDGYGTGTDGSVGFLGPVQNDVVTSCEVITVATLAP